MKTGLLLSAGLCFALGAAGPATAQNAADQARIQRMERDLRDLQAEVYRRNPLVNRNVQPFPPVVIPEPEPPPAMPDLSPMMRRIDELENGITRLTGQMEQLGHNIDLMNERTERLQKDLEFQAKQAADARAAAPPADALASAQPPSGPNAPVLRPLAPPPADLGTLPAGSTLPTPQAAPPPGQATAADMRRQFDGAMNLLSRAQYDQASEQFRAFADTYPEDARAGAALYWAGDIAYSVMRNYEEGARTFAELLKKYPMTARAPESMLKLGLSLFELDQTRAGCETLAALPAKYPDANAAIATRARNERRDRNCR